MTTTNKAVKFYYAGAVMGTTQPTPPNQWAKLQKPIVYDDLGDDVLGELPMNGFTRIEVANYTCNSEGHWSLYDNREVTEDFKEYIKNRVTQFAKYHKPTKKDDHLQLLFVVRRVSFSEDTGFIEHCVHHEYVDFRNIKEEKKVYVNGPKQDKEFLKKVGKHYVNS